MTLSVRPFIEGRSLESSSADLWTKYSPADGRILMEFATGCAADVDQAVASCRAAFEDGRWSELPADRRGAVLSKWADLIVREANSLAAMDTLEVGKPITDAENIDLALAPAVMRFNAVNADKAAGTVVPVDG